MIRHAYHRLLDGAGRYGEHHQVDWALVDRLVFACQGLPPASGVSAMLDGQWQQSNWKIPFNLKS